MPNGATAQHLKGLAWLALAVVIVLAFIRSLPLLASLFPPSLEARLFSHVDLFPGTQRCNRDDHALEQLVARLYPLDASDRASPIAISVVKRREVNAVTFLGGRIFVFKGLLDQADTPEELAGVLAHEIEHVKRRHASGNILRGYLLRYDFHFLFPADDFGLGPAAMEALVSLKFSRDQEREADEGAFERLRAAHVSAAGFKRFFEKAHGVSEAWTLLSTHPPDPERARLAERYLAYPSEPVLPDNEWRALKAMCR